MHATTGRDFISTFNTKDALRVREKQTLRNSQVENYSFMLTVSDAPDRLQALGSFSISQLLSDTLSIILNMFLTKTYIWNINLEPS